MTMGKMGNYRVMLQNRNLRPHLPETRWMTDAGTLRMLGAHSSVFIKPDLGSGGNGIIRVRKLSRGYEVRSGPSRKIVGAGSVLRTVRSSRRSNNRYLMQKGLQIARYQGKIFDIRVYMQKPEHKWVIAGMVARVAAPHKFLTNYHQGGHAEPLQKVLLNQFKNNQAKVDACHRKIEQLSMTIAETVSKWSSTRELGIDLALDKNGYIWILEANSHPGHRLFTQLADQTMYSTIIENKRKMAVQYPI
ncbi:YheC/YheD family protein [Paenibacillus sp. CECT 9249]|uniref:YheC/YheD family protein n=1 Tax=Paenibacillus sp. CECT 9249 TaxID=2845385 RepID=UPI001E57A262|nr:YheC/YheD family protein [Paenibacillus sp. CECT 9249]